MQRTSNWSTYSSYQNFLLRSTICPLLVSAEFFLNRNRAYLLMIELMQFQQGLWFYISLKNELIGLGWTFRLQVTLALFITPRCKYRKFSEGVHTRVITQLSTTFAYPQCASNDLTIIRKMRYSRYPWILHHCTIDYICRNTTKNRKTRYFLSLVRQKFRNIWNYID